MQEFRAPGRVNLIGDHTDYNEGFVLPIAIDLECVARVDGIGDGSVRIRSRELGDTVDLPADGGAQPFSVDPPWGRYPAGVLHVLASRGRPPVGMEIVLSSSVPPGAGLSSSAAIEVAVALAACDAAGFDLAPLELALACQEAEHIATGVPCGIMDQLASISGRRGCALLIDCRSYEVEPVPLPAEMAVLVVHSGVPRALAGSPYAERRAACEAAASRLSLRSLRDATAEQVAFDRRARHVVTENKRVLDAVSLLHAGDVEAFGRLLSASHASLRDDFEVSTTELDTLATALQQSGAFGARLTGGGFGGCAVAITARDDVERVAFEALKRYRKATTLEGRAFYVSAVDGAGPR